MKLTRRFFALSAVALILGCGGGAPPEEVDPVEITIRDKVVSALEGMLDEGIGGGSEIGAAMEDINELRSIDPDVAQEVEDVLMGIMNGESPNKAKIQELVDKVKAIPVKGG